MIISMTDYSETVKVLVLHYLKYREMAADKSLSYKTRMMYDGFVATREQGLIDLSNKIIKELERNHGIL